MTEVRGLECSKVIICLFDIVVQRWLILWTRRKEMCYKILMNLEIFFKEITHLLCLTFEAKLFVLLWPQLWELLQEEPQKMKKEFNAR